jgi:hypothetical protein
LNNVSFKALKPPPDDGLSLEPHRDIILVPTLLVVAETQGQSNLFVVVAPSQLQLHVMSFDFGWDAQGQIFRVFVYGKGNLNIAQGLTDKDQHNYVFQHFNI